MNIVKEELKVKDNVTSNSHRPWPVPFMLKGAVEQELVQLGEKEFLKDVGQSSWVAPIVPVPPKDGEERTCEDYKDTVNLMWTTIPNQDLRNCLLPWKMERRLPRQNSHKPISRCSWKRAQLSTSSNTILQGIDGAICYINNILVTGIMDEQHFEGLEEVVKRLKTNGLRVKSTFL